MRGDTSLIRIVVFVVAFIIAVAVITILFRETLFKTEEGAMSGIGFFDKVMCKILPSEKCEKLEKEENDSGAQTSIQCKDYDEGPNDIYEKSYAEKGLNRVEDKCYGSEAVEEAICYKNIPDSRIKNCPQGYKCKLGKCVEVKK